VNRRIHGSAITNRMRRSRANWSTMRWTTRDEAKSAVVTWIEEWYNRERMHSSLGDISPLEFESQFVTETM
jgi:transposase InsO family protein